MIANDLYHSGRFKSFPLKKPPTDSVKASQDWQKKGADYLVIGQVQSMTGDRYRVEFSLLNLFNTPLVSASTQQEAHAKSPPLLQQEFVVKKVAFRRLAHHISDLIYEKLTGDRGVFSTKIAYIKVVRLKDKPVVHRLEVADMDGYNPRMILESPLPIMSPSWSSDGRHIAYVSFEAKRARIYISDVWTGQRHLVAHYPGINGAPAWSPDGKQIALVLSKDGQRGHPKVYVANFDGSDLRKVTDGYSIDTEPSWTADGKSLIFTSDRGGSPQIYMLTIKTNEVQRLTYEGNYNARASFSSTGRHLVMLHKEQGQFNVALMDIKTGDLRLLTHSVVNESPSFSPNGRMVLYATSVGDKILLAIVSIDGRVSLVLPSKEGGDVQAPTWSPYLAWI